MKRSASILAAATVLIGGGGAATASASSQVSPAAAHQGLAFVTKSACSKAASANRARIVRSGGSIIAADSPEAGACFLSTKGWTYGLAYQRAAGPLAGDFDISRGKESAATSARLKSVKVAWADHGPYMFTTKRNCEAHRVNTIRVVQRHGGDINWPNTTQTCFKQSATKFGYQVSFRARIDRLAPFPYEKVHVESAWNWVANASGPNGQDIIDSTPSPSGASLPNRVWSIRGL